MTRRRPESRPLCLALALLATAAHAQEAPGSGTFQPRLAITQGWSDNLRMTERDKDAALITTFAPGFSVVRNSGTVRGSIDYTLSGVTYVKSTYASQIQNALRANVSAELIPATLSVNAQANIGQQSASAFGLQAPTLGGEGAMTALDNPNRRETGTLTVSPLLRGQVAGLLNIDLTGNFSMTEVRGSALGDSHGAGASMRVAPMGTGPLSWYLQATTQQIRPKAATANRNSSVVAGVGYTPNPDLRFGINAGQERNDFQLRAGAAQQGVTGGINADWAPTPRTRLSANWQQHAYGDGHGISLEHRMRSTVVTIADNRSVSLGNTGASGGLRTNYDLFFQLFASVEPDPVKRDALVRNQLTALGLSPDAPSATGFLSSGPSHLHSQLLSFTLQGVRANLMGNISRSVTSRLSGASNQGDLADNGRIEQRSYSLSASYRISPESGLSLTGSRQESNSDVAGRRTQLTSVMANWTGRLGSRVSVQLGARHSQFEGATQYSENAVTASLTQQF